MSYLWFTHVDAELAAQAEEGVVVGNAGDRVGRGVGTIDFGLMAETISDMDGLFGTTTGDLFLMGTSAAAVEAVADGASGEAIRAVRDLNIVGVGDASSAVERWVTAHNERLEGIGSSLAESSVDNLVESLPGDAKTVSIETRGQEPIRDGDELRRLAEGAVVIADAFEAATARTPPSG